MREEEKTKEQLINELQELRVKLAEAEKAKSILRTLMEYVPEGITIADAPGTTTIQMVSKHGQELTERSAGEIVGNPLELHAEKRNIFRPDGLSRPSNEEHNRRLVKDAVERQNELPHTILDHIPVMLCSFDAEGNPLLINREFERLLGWSLEDAGNTNLMAACYPDPGYRREVIEYMHRGAAEWREFSVRTKAGDFVETSWSNVILKDGTHIGIGIDWRERKKADMELRESEARYRSLFEDSPISLWEEDFSELKSYLDSLRSNGIDDFKAYFDAHPEEVVRCLGMVTVLNINKTGLSLYGAKSMEEFRNGLSLVVREDAHEAFKNTLVAIAEGKTRSDGESTDRALSGAAINIRFTWSVVPGHEDTFSKVLVSIVDMTDYKRVQEALEEQAEFLDLARDAILVRDGEDRIAFWNKGAEATYGWTKEEALGKPVAQLLPTESPVSFDEIRRSVFSKGEWEGELRQRTRTGEHIVIAGRWALKRDRNGNPKGFLEINRDVTDRRRAQLALERANRALRVLSESNYALVQENEEDALLTHICRIIAETGGYPLAWVGYAEEDEKKSVRPVAGWGPAKGYIDSIQVSWADSELGLGPIGRALREGRLKIAKDFGADPDLFPWRDAALRHGLHSNATFPLIVHGRVLGVLTIYSAEVNAFHEHEEEVNLLSTLADNLAYGIDAVRMHRERERAEKVLKTYMKKLQESNQALQDFASIASHDMHEPLRKISSFGRILNEQYGELLGEQGGDYLRRMCGAAERMQDLLTALLDYARVTTKANPFISVDLLELTRDVLDDLEVRISQTGGKVEIGSLPGVEADPYQMRQLLQNLIGNGLKYHGKSKPVVKVHGEKTETLARIYVEDNGIGFEEKYVDRIFEPLQRLHGRSQYEGTGIGLAICRKIVDRHGGRITARSEPGVGSVFIVELPVKQAESKNRSPEQSAASSFFSP